MVTDRFGNPASVAAYVGSASAFFGGLSLNDLAAILGIFFGLTTVLMNWYFKRKHLEIARKNGIPHHEH